MPCYLPHVHADFGERGLHRLRGFLRLAADVADFGRRFVRHDAGIAQRLFDFGQILRTAACFLEGFNPRLFGFLRLALGGGRCLFRFLCGFGGGGLLCRTDGGLCRLLCLYGPGGGIDGSLCGGLIGGAGFGLKPREALRLGFRRVRHGLCRLTFEGEGFFLRLAEMLVRGGQHFFRRLLEVG